MVPPAPVLKSGKAGAPAVGPVHHVVRFTGGRGLVAAAGKLAASSPGLTAESRRTGLMAVSPRHSPGNGKTASECTGHTIMIGRPTVR